MGRLRDDLRSWPWSGHGGRARQALSGTNLNGFRYGGLEEEKASPVQERLDWLASARPFSQQPYEELARVYRERGQVSDARKVRLKEQKERTRRAGLPLLLRAWNLFLEWTVGYGYRPGRIFGVLAAFAIGGAFLFHVAQHNNVMEAVSWHPDPCREELGPKKGGPVEVEVRGRQRAALISTKDEVNKSKLPDDVKSQLKGLPPAAKPQEPLPPCAVSAAECTSHYPCFYPAVYAIELLIPVVNLQQLTYWLPDMNANSKADTRTVSKMGEVWYLVGVWYLIYAWVAILLGWISVTALAAGISRVWRVE